MVRLTQDIDIADKIAGHHLYEKGRRIYVYATALAHGAFIHENKICCSPDQAAGIIMDLSRAGIIGFTFETDTEEEELLIWERLDDYSVSVVPTITNTATREMLKRLHCKGSEFGQTG